jgi:hypothetical protein
MAVVIVAGDLDSSRKAFADIKVKLEKETTRETAQAEVDTLT